MKNHILDSLLKNDPPSCRLFWDSEDGYREWLGTNPNGFVVNCDKQGKVPQYPMLHNVTHKLISSPKINNYTTNNYFKVCAPDKESLESWAKNRGLKLTQCSIKKCS